MTIKITGGLDIMSSIVRFNICELNLEFNLLFLTSNIFALLLHVLLLLSFFNNHLLIGLRYVSRVDQLKRQN